MISDEEEVRQVGEWIHGQNDARHHGPQGLCAVDEGEGRSRFTDGEEIHDVYAPVQHDEFEGHSLHGIEESQAARHLASQGEPEACEGCAVDDGRNHHDAVVGVAGNEEEVESGGRQPQHGLEDEGGGQRLAPNLFEEERLDGITAEFEGDGQDEQEGPESERPFPLGPIQADQFPRTHLLHHERKEGVAPGNLGAHA
jgi:hypothetical protein